MIKVSPDQNSIIIYNMKTFALANKEYWFNKRGETIQTVDSPNGKICHCKVYFAKQNIKLMVVLNNRSVQIIILEINEESISPC